VESLALSTLRLIEEHAMKDNTGQVLVQAPPTVANFLLNEKRASVVEIELRHKAHVVIVADDKLETPHIAIQRIKEVDMGEHSKPSYERLTAVEAVPLPKMGQTLGSNEQPAVSGIVPATPAPVREEAPAPATAPQAAPRRPSAPAPAATAPGGGIISRLFGWFRTGTAATIAAAPATAPSNGGDKGSARGNRQQQPRREERNRNAQGNNANRQRRDGGASSAKSSPQQNAQQQNRNGRQQGNGSEGTQRQPAQANAQAPKQERQQQPRGNAAEGKPGQAERAERKPVAAAPAVATTAATKPETQAPRPAAATMPAEPLDEAKLAALPAATGPEAADAAAGDAEGPSRRRRGRRGGRRRRRHDEAAATTPNTDQASELDDEDREEIEAAAEDAKPAAAPVPTDTSAATAIVDKPVAKVEVPAPTAPVVPRSAPAPRNTPPQAERHEPARVVLTEAPLAAAVATAFSLPPLPPIPEKPAAPNPAATETPRPAEANHAPSSEANPARGSTPPIAVAEKRDAVEAVAPVQTPAPAPAASAETHSEIPDAPLNGHAAPSPAAVQPQQGDLLGHVDIAGTPPAGTEARPSEAPEEELRRDATP
jgi:ribonuclease E